MVSPNHFLASSALDSAYETGNSKAGHVLDKLSETYKNVDSLALITGVWNFCEDVSLNTKVPVMLDYTKESNSEEDNPRDNECNLLSFLSSNSRGCGSEEKMEEVLQVTSSYILFDPGPYLDYVPIYAIDSNFGDGKSMEEGAVTVLFERPGVKFPIGKII
ncbi:hypothetical protein KY284_027059 [Solanum tuberosum]|nr:hypothetical protein KY284_027059 [Solanum tuberosum]